MDVDALCSENEALRGRVHDLENESALFRVLLEGARMTIENLMACWRCPKTCVACQSAQDSWDSLAEPVLRSNGDAAPEPTRDELVRRFDALLARRVAAP